MTIKEVEKELNISRANIRFYEKEGLLKPKRHNDNEYRDYSAFDVNRLRIIILFRSCNISIENIRLIFNGEKSLDEIFENQISIIENEVKQLEGAKEMCKKLAQEKESIDKIDTKKYINIMNAEERKGNKFYNITEDYIFATEKLYQSIIENKEFKGGENMKKGIKILVYVASFLLTFIFLMLFDYILFKEIDIVGNICFTSLLIAANLIGVKKYIEIKSGKKFTKKDNINHFFITILVMIIALLGYFTIKSLIDINKDPKDTILEMSLKKSLIDITREKYENDGNYIYAESHKILDYEIKGDKIYVYVATNYGIFNKNNCEAVDDTKNTLTMIYEKKRNDEGIYKLSEYNELIPNKIKNKVNVNYEDIYFKSQLNSYCNK